MLHLGPGPAVQDAPMSPDGHVSSLHMIQLEDRVLYSASPVDIQPDLADDANIQPEFQSARTIGFDFHPGTDLAAGWSEASSELFPATELVIVDGNVDNYQELVDGIVSTNDREFEVFVLDTALDGIDQITSLLQQYSDLDAVHFVTHGTEGQVQLGNQYLTVDSIGGYATDIAQWSSSFSDDADLLFYGCDLVFNSDGISLVESISELTGADVAASSDRTGHGLLGGDWELEFTTGTIESVNPFSAQVQQQWASVLAIVAVDDSYSTNDTGTLTVAAAGVLGNDSSTVVTGIVNGATLNYDASLDVDGNSVWEDSTNVSGFDFLLDGTVNRNDSLVGAPPGIDAAWVFDGSNGGVISTSAESFAGDPTNSSATFEIWFRPDSPSDNRGVLLDIGSSSDGTNLRLYQSGGDSFIEYVVQQNASQNTVVTADITTEMDSGEFIQLVATFDVTAGTAELFVNGVSVGQDVNLLVSDWSGGSEGISIAKSDGSYTSINDFHFNSFEGEIAAFRFYESVLADASVERNYNALTKSLTVTTFDATSAGGAAVNVAADGSFTWNPGTVFDYLDDGESVVDTFTYTASDAANSEVATVSITVSGQSNVLVVDTTDDVIDGDTSSFSELLADKGADGLISLREAIVASNNSAGEVTIYVGPGIYELSLGSAGDDAGIRGDLDILTSVTIIGSGAQSTIIDGDGFDRVFHIKNNSTIVTMSGVTIQGGSSSDNGAGIFVDNSSALILSDSVLQNNDVGSGDGGALHVHGTIDLNRVLITGNTANKGAGIFLHNSDGGSLTNVTISGNTAGSQGGGVWTEDVLTIVNSTIAYNMASNGGGLYDKDGNDITITNTILYNPGAQNSTWGINSGGNNIDSDGSANLLGANDLFVADPLLGDLAYNGGPTMTHALLAGSAAIDAGTASGAPATDQRGFDRDGTPDIGAYEASVGSLTNTNEFLVNETTEGVQATGRDVNASTNSVAAAKDGSYVVVWTSSQATGDDGDGNGVMMRRFNADGTPITGEIQVNQTTADDQQYASVAMDATGRYVIVWVDVQNGGDEGTIYMRRFNADGTAIDANDVRVNTTTAGEQIQPSVAVNSTGQIVIAWQDDNGDEGIRAKTFNMITAATGGAISTADIEVTATATAVDPAIDINDNGDFIVVWAESDGTYWRPFDSTGTPTRSADSFDSDGALETNRHPDVVILSDGSFVASVRNTNLIIDSVQVRMFASDGTEQPGNVYFTGYSISSLAKDSTGNVIVTYDSSSDNAIEAVVFSTAGNTLTERATYTVDQTTSGTQVQPSVAMLDEDNFVVVWSGNGNQAGEVDDSGVFARQFSLNASVNNAPSADAGSSYTITEGSSLSLDASSSSDPDGDTLTYKWDLDNDGNYGEVGEPTSESPTVSWTTLQSFGINDDGTYTIGVQVDDGNGGVDTSTTTVTVNNIAPTLTTTGSGTAIAGSVYTLNLSATDPGADTITGWTINWGDGTIDTIAGNPTTVTHTYTANQAGFTFNILSSASDEDGIYLQNELLVASSANDRLFRYSADGSFLQEFAVGDGTDYPVDPIIGPDGNLYVSGWNSDNVLRYNAVTGAFIDTFVSAGSGGLDSAAGLAFGSDGNLYVASRNTSEVLRFDATTGAFIDAFVTAGSGGLDEAEGLVFGPDGDLFVSDYNNGAVYKYDGSTGAFESEFVTAGSGGLGAAEDLVFGPDGNLYVADDDGNNVLRYNGTTGAFIDEFVSAGSGGLNSATGLAFGPDGNLYVGSWGTDSVLRYDGGTGLFVDAFVTAGSGGVNNTDYFSFLPGHQVTVSSAANNAPTADAGSSYTITEGNSLSLDASGSTDPDGDTLIYQWDLDNDGVYGESGEPTTESPTVSWATLTSFGIDDGGIYTVGLQVDDGNGGVDTTTTTITVNDVLDLVSDLVLHLEFEDGTGTTAVDSSGNNNDAALDGDAEQDWVAGPVGSGAFHFDYTSGDEDFFVVPNSVSLENVQEADEFTLAAWFNPDDVPPNVLNAGNDHAYGVIVKEGDHTGIWFNSNQKFKFEHTLFDGFTNIYVQLESVNTYATGVFHHVAATVDRSAGTASLYVDGVLDATVSFTAGLAALEYNTETWKVGTARDTFPVDQYAYPAKGSIDDVRIYERDLSASDIAALHALGSAVNEAPIATDDSYTVGEGGTFSGTVVSGWYNPSWKSRQQITFDNTSQGSDLLNHPVLVKLHTSAIDAVNIDYTKNTGCRRGSPIRRWQRRSVKS